MGKRKNPETAEKVPPLPRLWDYRHDDVSTWKYIDYHKGNDASGRPLIREWIKNPLFAFAHLDTGNK